MIQKKAPVSEKTVHKQIVLFIKWHYPKVIFHTDFAAGNKMTIGQAVQNKELQSGKGFPDLFNAHPKNGYSGLFLEVKSCLSKVYKKDGNYIKNEHIQAQAEMLDNLNAAGYKAEFGCGFDHCKSIITEYFKN